MAFTLQPHAWYAMEYVFGSAQRHHSPVWLRTVMPQKNGRGILQLEFYHANYAEGVRDKVYELQVVHRDENYLIALRVEEGRAVLGAMILERIAAKGVAIATGSACSHGARKPSHVAAAMGLSYEEARCCVRVSLSVETTLAEIRSFLELLAETRTEIVEELATVSSR